MTSAEIDVRRVIGDVAVLVICVWTGYFLCNTWHTLNRLELVLLELGVAACYVALVWALARAGRGLPGATLGARLLCGLLLGGVATFAGVLTRWPESAPVGPYALALAGYVGLAASLRGPYPVAKGTFAVVCAGLIGGGLVLAGLGLTRPHGPATALLGVWLAARLAWLGHAVGPECRAERVEAFAESALAGTGIFAGALLVIRIPEGRRELAELAWPMLAVVFSVVLIRVWPGIRKKTAGAVRSGGA